VENPREVVNQGDKVRVKILEIDSERRRLSLSLKRVEDQILPLRSAEGAPQIESTTVGAEIGDVPDLGLSEDVFTDSATAEEAPPLEPPAAEPAADQPEAEAPAEEPAAEEPAPEEPAPEEEPPAEDAAPEEDQPA
jgi:small subunit ribosomal protein S1